VSYFTVGRESRAAPGRQFNRPIFHLGVEQFDRGGGPMGSGIEIGVIPLRRSAASAGQKDLSSFKIAPAMGAGVTDPVEMLAR